MLLSTQLMMERVEHGARFLNVRVPGWYEMIDVERLDIRNKYACVLGQVYGEYSRGLQELFGFELCYAVQLQAVKDYGFDAGPQASFAVLTAIWKDVVRGRQQAAQREREMIGLRESVVPRELVPA
jgi:hypothetical protein